jgi:hypothetical protein
MPELSDDPTPEQVDAWVELAELVQDPDFKASVRRAAEHQAADRADGDQSGLHHELTNSSENGSRRHSPPGSSRGPSRPAWSSPSWSAATPRRSARPTPPTTAAGC